MRQYVTEFPASEEKADLCCAILYAMVTIPLEVRNTVPAVMILIDKLEACSGEKLEGPSSSCAASSGPPPLPPPPGPPPMSPPKAPPQEGSHEDDVQVITSDTQLKELRRLQEVEKQKRVDKRQRPVEEDKQSHHEDDEVPRAKVSKCATKGCVASPH